MRSLLSLVLAAGVLLSPSASVAQSASTTRIETRPFYGATVTLEEGVRVFRPLPPHGRVIINPGGVTPLNLSYEESRSISHNYNHGAAGAGDGGTANAYGGVSGGYGDRRRHGHASDGVGRGPGGRPVRGGYAPAGRH